MKSHQLLNACVCFCVAFAAIAVAEDYRYTPFSSKRFSGIWDSSSNWTTKADVYAADYPHALDDTAFVFGGGTAVHYSGFFQMWPTSHISIANLAVVISNEVYIGDDSDNRLIFTNSNGRARIALTNMVPDHQQYVNDGQLSFIFDTIVLASNPLDVTICSMPYLDGGAYYSDAAGMLLDYDTIYDGPYPINFSGGGFLIIGQFYATPPTPRLVGSQPVTLNGCPLVLNEGAVIKPPLVLRSRFNTRQQWDRCTFYALGSASEDTLTYHVDFVLSNAYFQHPFSDWITNTVTKGGAYNRGSVTFLDDWSLVAGVRNGADQTVIEFDCDVRGRGQVWKGYSDSEGGGVDFVGSISPGIDDIDLLYIRALTNAGKCNLGHKDKTVDINMDVDGLGDGFGVDADALATYNLGAVDLGNMNLNINVGRANPYRTYEIMYSLDAQFQGDFADITWTPSNRAGTVVVTPESVFLTNIPPASSNFFDLTPSRLIFVQGETQQFLTAQSMFNLDIYTTGAAHWVTVPASVSIPAAPVDIPVQVPHDQPTTNNYGLASTVVRVAATDDSSVFYDVPVFVVQPGYFELDKDMLYFVEDKVDVQSVRVYSPLSVTVSATAVNAPFITVDPASVALDNEGDDVDVIMTAQPAGTTGTVRFANASAPGVAHDVQVNVIPNGYFEVAPSPLYFLLGQTQQLLTVQSPLSVDIDINTTDEWIAVTSQLALDGNGYRLPVLIPALFEARTGSITLVSHCFSNLITYTVPVLVTARWVCFPSVPMRWNLSRVKRSRS